jgi:hypothetical protein
MTATHNQGPAVIAGYYPGSGGSNPEAGPSATNQCDSLINPAYVNNPGMTGLGHVKGWFNHPYPTLVDAVPVAKNAALVATLASGGVVPAALPLNIPLTVTAASGRAFNVPLVPYGQTIKPANAVNVTVIEPGHTIGTATAASNVLTAVSDTRLLIPYNLNGLGQYIGVVGAGSGSTTIIARVVSKTATTVTLDQPMPVTVAGAPIIIMDPTGSAVSPFVTAGAVAEMDLYSALARVLSVTTVGADVGYIVTIVGYDLYMQPMTEAITTTSTATVNGKKAFKYVQSISVSKAGGGTTAANITIGTTDIFGFSIRSEAWEYMSVFYAGAFVSTNTGWTPGLTYGTPSTASTADVRGTYAVQSAANGTNRLAIFTSIPMRQVVDATYANYSSLLGQAQA